MNSIRDLANQYFRAFSNKDIDTLESMFEENIFLRDWEINAKGIVNVINANQKIFDSVNSIKATPINLFIVDFNVIAELEILINQKEKIKVVDIIKFDQDLKIISIKAFKG